MKQYQPIAGQINYHRKETVSFVETIQKWEHEDLSYAIRKENTDALVLAESIKEEWNPPIKLALEEKRLLIVTACNDKVHRVNHQSAYERNEIILSLANHIIIGLLQARREHQ